jgi:hypothetical protein
MLMTSDVRYRFVLRALSRASAAVLVTSLLSCGGGGGTSQVSGMASEPLQSAPTSATTPQAPAPASTNTAAALEKFWGRYGAKDSFTPMYLEVLTKLLEAEDKVFVKDYRGARVIVEALIAKYPLMKNDQPDNVWGGNYATGNGKSTRPHLGEPGAYAHLRMLDDITKVGVSKPLPGTTPLQMAIVMPVCSDIVPKTGPTLLNRRLSPEIGADSYEVVRQSLRLFQSYILAISGGELRLELNFYKIDSCTQINKITGYDYNAPIRQLPSGVVEKTDMFWLIYPSDLNVGSDAGGGSGMGGFEASGKPVFISEDDWVIKKRDPDQGGGSRTEVERRIYLPEWVQHEFFHHLFSSWPELKLEETGHQWFDKSKWPADFTGKIEEDYYSEALNKRLYKATPSITQKLKRANK